MERLLPKLPPLAIQLIRFVGSTWSYVPVRREIHRELLAGDRPVVAAFLHSRTLPLLHFFSAPENGRWLIMCSESRDGRFMAAVERGLGYEVVFGSSGSGGARALVDMIKMVRRDPKLQSCMAIDGSRGPRGVCQNGIAKLAQKTGAVILPVAGSADRVTTWRKSWDRMLLPHPNATIPILFGTPISVPATLDEAAMEAMRRRVEQAVLDLHREADAEAGFKDSEPLQDPTATKHPKGE
jgi:lysophospholipid acyltransferase (LPLAT)-like uncharacterized protein